MSYKQLGFVELGFLKVPSGGWHCTGSSISTFAAEKKGWICFEGKFPLQADVKEQLIFPLSLPKCCRAQPNPRVSPAPAQPQLSCSTSRAWLPQPSALSLTHRETHSSGTSPGLAGHFGCFLHRIKQLPGLSVNIIWRDNIRRNI